jgi:hypothetical protein
MARTYRDERGAYVHACTEADILAEPLTACPRCGLKQQHHICCPACGWCEYGAELGCPTCGEEEADAR